MRACLAVTGTVEADRACQREADGEPGFGHDDCAAGLACTYLGVLPPAAGGTRMCRRFCHSDDDCPGSQVCARVSDQSPPDGFCGPPCRPFGNDCGSAMTCADVWSSAADPNRYLVFCRVPGPLADGASCGKDEDCGVDRACIASSPNSATVCRPLCDAAHPCAAGSCQVEDAASGVGYCV